MKRFPRWSLFLFVALAFTPVGCVAQATGSSGTTYSYAWWAIALPPLAAKV